MGARLDNRNVKFGILTFCLGSDGTAAGAGAYDDQFLAHKFLLSNVKAGFDWIGRCEDRMSFFCREYRR